MGILKSQLDLSSETYKSAYEGMRQKLDEVEQDLQVVLEGGGEKYVQRHRQRGKLLVRERIEMLLDRDSPFLELSPLAGHGTEDPLGGGLVTGVGVVCGVECLISANDPTVRGGTTSPTTVTKQLRAFEVAEKNRLPLINLTESGGADLPNQSRIFVPGGRSFRDITRLSAQGTPTITLVFGSSTAGGAYVPGMSDYTIMIKEESKVFLGGPPLVKMAIDEVADEEDLGGAEMHARQSGLADYLAEDEMDAIRLGRQVVSDLNWRKRGPGPAVSSEDIDEPLYDREELLGCAAPDPQVSVDAREILARVLDGSRFDEFKPLYGTTLVTGWGSICGFPVGVLANNGILFSEESQKGAQFIQLSNFRDIPLVFVQNITGFMVGTRYEQGGIIKDGAKLINAVSNSGVPHITLMVGASYGAGNYGMSGRAYDPRFVFSWPNHRIAVMGGKQLAGVMSIVRRTAAERAGRSYDEEQDAETRRAIEEQIEQESSALYATGQLWDDGIIDPRDTRTVLGIALSAAHSAPVEGTEGYASFRM